VQHLFDVSFDNLPLLFLHSNKFYPNKKQPYENKRCPNPVSFVFRVPLSIALSKMTFVYKKFF
jgi:hypothetical protein